MHVEIEHNDVKQLRKKFQESEGSHIWPYMDVDSKYGHLFPRPSMNLKRLQSGKDNGEFELLAEKLRKGGGKYTVNVYPL